MIHVIAAIEVKAGRTEEFLREFHRVVPHVLAEDGCIEYGPTIDFPTDLPAQLPPRPNVVTILEKWRDLPSLQAHLAAPHMADYRNAVKDMVETVSLQILQPA